MGILLDSCRTWAFCYLFWAKWANAHFGQGNQMINKKIADFQGSTHLMGLMMSVRYNSRMHKQKCYYTGSQLQLNRSRVTFLNRLKDTSRLVEIHANWFFCFSSQPLDLGLCGSRVQYISKPQSTFLHIQDSSVFVCVCIYIQNFSRSLKASTRGLYAY